MKHAVRMSAMGRKQTLLAFNVHESFSPPYAARMSTKHIDTAADLVRFGAA
jgi:hypothetical protein